jgi:hypothetical protein
VPSDEAQFQIPVAKAAVARMEPVPGHSRASRKLRRLAHAQQQTDGEELAEALYEATEELSE